MFMMVPLDGMCFIKVTLWMFGNSCPVLIACVARLDLQMFGFLYAFKCSEYRFFTVFLFGPHKIYYNLCILFYKFHYLGYH